MLNSRQVEAFRVVMVAGGITSASKLMHISQPAVSRLIHDFEKAVALVLFEKRGSRLTPTREALTLYREVERQFIGLGRVAQAADDLRTGQAGALRIAAMPALAVGVLPRFAGRFLKERPNLGLTVFASVSAGIFDWIESGHCEIGFVHSPTENAAVFAEKLLAVPAVAVVPSGHALSRKRHLRPIDFNGEPFIAPEATVPMRHHIDSIFAHEGVTCQTRAETPASMIACGMVASGLGISIVDPFSAREYAGRGVVTKSFRPTIQFEVVLLRPAHRELSQSAREFVEEFREELGRSA